MILNAKADTRGAAVSKERVEMQQSTARVGQGADCMYRKASFKHGLKCLRCIKVMFPGRGKGILIYQKRCKASSRIEA